jgi:hypothetical protein
VATLPKNTTGPPDFVGVGAQRAGTTWWFDLLIRHPQIRPPRGRRKELHFFDRFGAEPMLDHHVADYHAQFRRRPGQIAGEWTPRYMGDAWALRLVRRAAPDTKVLVLLRDPIERYRSGVIHRATRGRDRRRELISSDAIERGRYGTQTRRLLELFGKEQLLVLQYERCVLDPIGQYRRTLAHLGVDDHVPDDVSSLRGRSMAGHKEELWPDLLTALHVALDPEVAILEELVDGFDRELWPNFAHAG